MLAHGLMVLFDAIRMTWTILRTTSAGRFWPSSPLGMGAASELLVNLPQNGPKFRDQSLISNASEALARVRGYQRIVEGGQLLKNLPTGLKQLVSCHLAMVCHDKTLSPASNSLNIPHHKLHQCSDGGTVQLI